jgi:TRAP-type C4-dicarboxylate transport system substrate-binding protein
MRGKIFMLAGIILFLTVLPWLVCNASEGRAVVLRATINVPSTQPPAKALKYWGDLVTKNTHGRVKFNYLWGGSVTKAGEEIPAIQKGVVDAGFFTAPYYPGKMVLNSISFVVPFDTPDPRLMLKMYYRVVEEVPEFVAEIEQYNLKLIYPFVFGSYEMLSRKPVKTLADMKGLKAAVIGATFPKWFEAIGAVPISMPAPDRYTARQTGLIDASILPLAPSDAFKWTDVAKNCTLIHLGCVVLGSTVMNADDFKNLSPEDQKVVLEAGKQTARWSADQTAEEDARIMEKWKRQGVAFYTLSASDMHAWAEQLKHVPYDWAKEWDAKGHAATKTLESYLKAARDLGYKYPVDWVKR